MIVFDLRCGNDHVFEAWFRDGAAFDDQVAAGEVACPVCGDGAIVKAPMTPNLARGARAPGQGERHDAPGGDAGKAARLLGELRAARAHVEANFDHVGERFPEEARKIHYGEAEARDIYGETSDDEARALKEEGIAFGRLPWIQRHDS